MTDPELIEYFKFQCEKGFSKRFPDFDSWNSEKQEQYRDRLEYEIGVILSFGFEGYFCIVKDILDWCRKNSIPIGPGRGSISGALTAYALGITEIDSIKYNLIFERFLNEGRKGAGGGLCDIDMDFSREHREQVLEYVASKYGQDCVCRIGTFGLMRAKNAVKNVARVLGHPYVVGDELSKLLLPPIHGKPQSLKTSIEKVSELKEHYEKNGAYGEILRIAEKFEGLVNNVSAHAAGEIIAPYNLSTKIPMFKGKGGEVTAQWEMNNLEKVGYVKFDFLGLDTLTRFYHALELIKKRHNIDLDINTIDREDSKVFNNIKTGNVDCLFQLENSNGIKDLTLQVRPERLEDLSDILAVYRPGPLSAPGLSDYLACRAGDKEPEYLLPELESTLKDTSAFLIYQEQVLNIAKELASYSLTDADLLRRAIGKKKEKEMAQHEAKFKDGCARNNLPADKVNELWELIKEHSSYSFNKCIDGGTYLHRTTTTKGRRNYTIEELYRLKNDLSFAKEIYAIPMRSKLLKSGYGKAWSLNENNRLILNQIADIRYAGYQTVYEIKVMSGASIRATINHKLPTPDGEKKVSELVVGSDKLYILDGYIQEENKDYRFGSEGNNFPKPGQIGFQTKDTTYTKFKYYKENLKKDFCEKCGSKHRRLEIHHIDNNIKNNSLNNLITVCPSCHKEAHYKIGRTKMGQKGLLTRTEKIISITELGKKKVYDVEMAHPYHTFTTKEGVVSSNSHSIAYSLITYQCAYLKTYYPSEWMCAVMICDANNKDQMIKYLAECKRMGIEVLPPNINDSDLTFSLNEKGNIVFGLSPIRNLGEGPVSSILEERETRGKYKDLVDFLNRADLSKINKLKVQSLIKSGCFDYAGKNRSSLLSFVDKYWEHKSKFKSYESKLATYFKRKTKYDQRLSDIADGKTKAKPLKEPVRPEYPELPTIPNLSEIPDEERLAEEHSLLGFYIDEHPLDSFNLKGQLTIDRIKQLKDSGEITLACMVAAKQEITTKTKKERMAFLTLEDATGQIEAVAFSKIYSRHLKLIESGKPLFIYGYLEVTQGETDSLCKIRIGKVQELTKVVARLPKKKNIMTDIVVKPDKIFNAIDWLKTVESGNIKVRLGFELNSGNKVMLNKVFLVNRIPSEFSHLEWQNGQS